ncbi:Alpha/gamma-adaptin-binding protein p34 [Moelleriella libera RCEF 2490]|uniref:Alpha/gamma-adaptin-binding protein p34 n=1 Tax=Moelleriella libera RCEF 2490 TaxID=1081109 RepID=A0A167ZNI2_9HYPO|nr:Alpha/gamma-adaptin-binding protein p34 [Moelleriella libera RCEF 2490]
MTITTTTTTTTTTSAMRVRNPRRILAVSLESQADHLCQAISELTGKQPQTPPAGTTHNLQLRTAYYTATVPIWLDTMTSPSEWADTFLSEEAIEVLAALGGLVLVFAPSPDARDAIRNVGKVVHRGLGGFEWDGVRLAVGITAGETYPDFDDEMDEVCAEAGLEYVRLGKDQPAARNEFGDKTGMERVKEALEANDWSHADEDDAAASSDEPRDDGLGFALDPADQESLQKALWGDSEEPSEAKVEHVEELMQRLRVVREAGEGLPEPQRRRMAARAVQEAMKELQL